MPDTIAPAVPPMPSGGGSYVRDPVTLELAPADTATAPAAEPEPVAAPVKPARAAKPTEGV